MFNGTQYVIQEQLKSRIMLTITYAIKDVDGYLLGYIKNRKLKSDFWFEETDGTRLGEARVFLRRNILLDRCEVYDAQNRLLATIRQVKWGEWRIKDLRGKQLARGKQPSKILDRFQILAPDGGVIAKIQRKGDLLLRNSYNINIRRQSLNPLIIISCAHLIVPKH